jgi:WD40 repeat protein
VAYSPDGSRIVSGGADETVRVWDAETGQELTELTGHAGTVNSVAYSPDGAHGGGRIVSGGSDGTVRVWDVSAALNTGAETRQALTRLTGHTGSVNSVAYSPDGSRIVSGGEDGTVRLWFGDIEALLELADSLIQRDSPIFLGDERIRFGFDEQPAREH